MIGRTFGRLTVVANATARKGGRRQVICDCDCGESITCDPRSLKQGHTQSCGCFHRDQVSAAAHARATHGDAGSKEYVSWIHMKGRCLNPKNLKYKDYGGRGIRVCDAWSSSYETFLSDMGRAPTNSHTVERSDVNGHYEPSNCRWATPLEQARNKRHHRFVQYLGKTIPLSEACELSGVPYRSALWRLNSGKDWMPPPSAPVHKDTNEVAA